MDTKKLAKRGMIIFLVMVALCMFFARTVQNLTTPKVRFTRANSGRLTKTYSLNASVFFSDAEDIYIQEAEDYPIVIKRVYASANTPVKQGELLFLAQVDKYEETMRSATENYRSKAGELALLDAQNRRNPTDSERNRRYTALIDAMETLSKARATARSQDLGEDAWAAEQAAYDAARQAFYDTYVYSTLAVTDAVFEYVQNREKLLLEIEALEESMAALERVAKAVENIRAPRDGVVISCDVKAGDTYQGAAPLYQLSAEGANPVLRAKTEERFSVDTKATVKGDWNEQSTVVVASGLDSMGERYVDFELNDKILEARGGLSGIVRDGEVKVTISNRASASTTLINASCLREGENGTYVYVATYVDGGMMGGYYKAVETPVTVIDKSDTQVSVQESLDYSQIIDREDRPLSNNARVMEQET